MGDLLNEEAQRTGQSSTANAQAWSPYESKTVSFLYYSILTNNQMHFIDVSS